MQSYLPEKLNQSESLSCRNRWHLNYLRNLIISNYIRIWIRFILKLHKFIYKNCLGSAACPSLALTQRIHQKWIQIIFFFGPLVRGGVGWGLRRLVPQLHHNNKENIEKSRQSTIFPRIVFAETILFLKWKMWKFLYSFRVMTIF